MHYIISSLPKSHHLKLGFPLEIIITIINIVSYCVVLEKGVSLFVYESSR